MNQAKKINVLLCILILAVFFGNSLPVSAYFPVCDLEDSIVTPHIPVTKSSSDSPNASSVGTEPSMEKNNAPQIHTIIYQVNAGDTLSQIARNFQLTSADLAELNGITNPNRLQIGQKLEIPMVNSALPEDLSTIKRVMVSTLTAYTAGFESTGKTPSSPAYGVTFSGLTAEEGRTIAVDPKVIPLGSTVFIDGVGVRKAEDSGSAIKGSRIDVFMNDLGQAQEFGVKKNVRVYLLAES